MTFKVQNSFIVSEFPNQYTAEENRANITRPIKQKNSTKFHTDFVSSTTRHQYLMILQTISCIPLFQVIAATITEHKSQFPYSA